MFVRFAINFLTIGRVCFAGYQRKHYYLSFRFASVPLMELSATILLFVSIKYNAYYSKSTDVK